MGELYLRILLDKTVLDINEVCKGIAETREMAKAFGMEKDEFVNSSLIRLAEQTLKAISDTEHMCKIEGYPIKIEFDEKTRNYAWHRVEA